MKGTNEKQRRCRRALPVGGIFWTATFLLAISAVCSSVSAFQSTLPSFCYPPIYAVSTTAASSALSLSSNGDNNGITTDNDNTDRFSRKVRLREEAESPFRKVRYFFYLNIAGGATTSLFISIARIAAALSGVNTELMDESVRNAVIDLVGLAAVAYFWKQDQEAENSRLKRATKGAELAKLNVRASKALLLDSNVSADELQKKIGSSTFTTTLASFRRERGIEKRVVIYAAGSDKIAEIIEKARALQSDLADNDLVVVPVVMPQGVAPSLDDETMPTNVALPVTSVGTNYWKTIVDEEAAEAVSQGVNIEQEGFCIILKKNGRVGQRTRGIFLDNLVGNVVARKEAGMDVKNI